MGDVQRNMRTQPRDPHNLRSVRTCALAAAFHTTTSSDVRRMFTSSWRPDVPDASTALSRFRTPNSSRFIPVGSTSWHIWRPAISAFQVCVLCAGVCACVRACLCVVTIQIVVRRCGRASTKFLDHHHRSTKLSYHNVFHRSISKNAFVFTVTTEKRGMNLGVYRGELVCEIKWCSKSRQSLKIYSAVIS